MRDVRHIVRKGAYILCRPLVAGNTVRWLPENMTDDTMIFTFQTYDGAMRASEMHGGLPVSQTMVEEVYERFSRARSEAEEYGGDGLDTLIA